MYRLTLAERMWVYQKAAETLPPLSEAVADAQIKKYQEFIKGKREEIAIIDFKSAWEGLGLGEYNPRKWEAMTDEEKSPYYFQADQIISLLTED